MSFDEHSAADGDSYNMNAVKAAAKADAKKKVNGSLFLHCPFPHSHPQPFLAKSHFGGLTEAFLAEKETAKEGRPEGRRRRFPGRREGRPFFCDLRLASLCDRSNRTAVQGNSGNEGAPAGPHGRVRSNNRLPMLTLDGHGEEGRCRFASAARACCS